MLTRSQSRAIVASTCQLAGSLDLRVVAEGIENRPTADALREMNCDLAQGYYFAPPAPAQEITERLAAHTLVGDARVSGA